MTQTDLAKRLRVSPQFICLWLKGERGLKPARAIEWGKILDVEPQLLVFAPVEDRARIVGLNGKVNHR